VDFPEDAHAIGSRGIQIFPFGASPNSFIDSFLLPIEKRGIDMSKEVYKQLRSHFHKHPLGFPETESAIELKILQRLFSEEEAEMALQLTPKPETAKSLSIRLHKEFKELDLLLERMAGKGQILTLGQKENRAYLLVPYVPGVWEFQVNRMDRGFAGDVEAYYPSQAKEMYSSATPPLRVVPVEKNIPGALKVFPFEVASEIVKGAKKIALSDCICRKHKKLIGKGCHRPHEQVCMYLSPLAEYFIEQGWGKEASVDDALRAIERGEQAGLVRISWMNVQKGPTGLCQCCPCCCHTLHAVYGLRIPKALAKSNFVPIIDLEQCTGCESCVDICPMDALALDGNKVAWNPARCIGCGLCVSECATGSIKLERVVEEQVVVPPETYSTLMTVIAHEKDKTYFYK